MAETQTHFTAQGLIIRTVSVGENDRLVTVFTKEYGVLKAYVPGAKSIKSKRGAATSLLTYSNLSLVRKGEFYRITEASAVSCFFVLGIEPRVLFLSQYFCELCDVFVQPGTPNPEFLRLILNSLHFIVKEKKYPPFIKAITEFRIAVISGFMPDLLACSECGAFEDDVMYFNPAEGYLICSACAQQSDSLLALDRTLLSALRHIAFSEFGKLYAFEIPENSADALSDITEKYLLIQTGNDFRTLDFYHENNI